MISIQLELLFELLNINNNLNTPNWGLRPPCLWDKGPLHPTYHTQQGYGSSKA